jgi:hypothetical protein
MPFVLQQWLLQQWLLPQRRPDHWRRPPLRPGGAAATAMGRMSARKIIAS